MRTKSPRIRSVWHVTIIIKNRQEPERRCDISLWSSIPRSDVSVKINSAVNEGGKEQDKKKTYRS